ncbi:ATP12 ATPase family protein [Purpureocillium lavendulum]|uniref:ATP12 ATPase family protein n=1 Tax=Purpureocillium lavendulum TaxID=1247861 RepID=A0AB34FZ51_9HYPO|nr:ATP12 ATPase family protein [Purpureocillium lavendulum]
MRPPVQLPLRLLPRTIKGPSAVRSFHSSIPAAANVAPILGTGPPPEPPTPEARNINERVARRKKQAEMLKAAKVIRNSKDGKQTTLRKRFWKEASVQEVDGALQVFLDTRPLRHPQTKEIIRLPTSKPSLAAAIALEWDVLTSAQQATRQHLIPLTSLVCRAIDIAEDDASNPSGTAKVRKDIATTLMRYLDTDSLLCWAPPAGQFDLRNDAGESLRDVQKQTAEETVSFLTTHVWPGITIEPVLDGHAIVPRNQPEGVREVVQGWVEGLSPWEIAGLERATLAGKSLVAAARFVAAWSEGPVGKRELNADYKFGIEEAAKAVSLEVDWQATQWGEVEDTHDVNKEDVRRQLGSVVLLVTGTGSSA